MGTASIVVPSVNTPNYPNYLNAGSYEITANYSSDKVDFAGSSGSEVLQVALRRFI